MTTSGTTTSGYSAKDTFNNSFTDRYNNIQSAAETAKNQPKGLFGGSAWGEATNYLNKATSKLNSVLGDNYTGKYDADAVLNAFNSLSNDDKWDVYQNLQRAKNGFTTAYSRADNAGDESLKNMYGAGLQYVDLYDSLLADVDKGDKSFGKSVGDYITSGGVAQSLSRPWTGAVSNIMGRPELSKSAENMYAINNAGNHGAVQAADFTANLIANAALAGGTGGAYTILGSGTGVANEVVDAISDRDRMYYVDANGNIVRQNQTDLQKASDIGGAALNLGLNLLGAKGIGPTINTGSNTIQGLAQSGQYGEIGKALGKYALKEIPWAAATSLGDTAIQAIGYGDQAWQNYGENLGRNIIGDVAMDVSGAVRQGVRQNTLDNNTQRTAQDTQNLQRSASEDGLRTSIVENEINDRATRDYTPGIDKVLGAFNTSGNQEIITARNGQEFSLGDFGKESLQRKANEPNHGLSRTEIANVLDTSNSQSVAGDSSFRKDNIAWFGDLPNGDRATVITRKNRFGQQEVINAYKNNPGYEAELISQFGTPAQSRTGNLGLEDLSAESAAQGHNIIIPQGEQNVNAVQLPQDIQNMRINDNISDTRNVFTGEDLNTTVNAARARAQEAGLDSNIVSDMAYDDLQSRGITPDNLSTRQWAQEINSSFDNIIRQNTQTSAPETKIYRALTGETGRTPAPTPTPSESETSGYATSKLATGETGAQNIFSKIGRTMQKAQANATRKETRDIGIEDAGQLLNTVRRRTGVADIETQARIAEELTGGKDSLLDAIQRQALSATEDGSNRYVDLTDIYPEVDKLIDSASNTLIKPKEKTELAAAIKQDLSNTSIDAITKANDLRAAAKQMFVKNERTPDKGDALTGRILSQVADMIETKTYAEIPKDNVDAMFETAEMQLRENAKIAKQNGNNKIERAYTNLADEMASAERTIGNYRSFKKNFVDVNKLYTKTAQGSTAWNNNTLTTGTAVMAALASKNPLLAVPTAIATKALAPAAGELANRVSAEVGGKVADFGDNLTARVAAKKNDAQANEINKTSLTDKVVSNYYDSTNPQMQIYSALTNDTKPEAEKAAGEYIKEATAELSQPVATTPSAGETTIYNALTGGTTATTSTNATTTNATVGTTLTNSYIDLLERAMQLAMDAGDANAWGSLLQMYNSAVADAQKESTSEQNKLTDTQRRAYAAESSLNELEQLTPDLGYMLSDVPVIGNIATLGGNTYDAAATSLATQIGYMLSGANIKEEEAQRIGESYVPQPFDSEETRKLKLQRARRIIEQYKNTYTA